MQDQADDEARSQRPKAQLLSSAPSASMVAIMEREIDEMRRMLNKFKVSTVTTPGQASDGQLQTPAHADILVFGPSGSGKSSLIRTFYMALHRVRRVPSDFAQRIIVKDTAMNEGTLKYVSAVVKPLKEDQRGAVSSSAIICHDTRGHIWMDEREQVQLGIIMDGSVKDDSIVQQRNYRYAHLLWEFWRKDVQLFPPEILHRKNGINTRPHALLFVFDGSMEEIPNGDEETRFYCQIIQMARAKGYLYPQVVLTRIDRVEEALNRKNASLEPAEAELRLRQVLDAKIEDVVSRLDVSRSSVHFIENYHDGGNYEEGRNMSVDFHALKILTHCVSHVDAFLLQHSHNLRASQCSMQ